MHLFKLFFIALYSSLIRNVRFEKQLFLFFDSKKMYYVKVCGTWYVVHGTWYVVRDVVSE